MHILITAGGTREYIDPVRFISNASTGRMGCAIACAALRTGNEVTMIVAPLAVKPPRAAKIVPVETAAEMFSAVKDWFQKCDCLIMAAAVSDYRPAGTSRTKIKKADGDLTLVLKPTADILKWAGRHKTNQIVVGFALEDRAIRSRAEKKMKEKNLDMIVANPPAAIGADISSVLIKTVRGDWVDLGYKSKTTIARRIIAETHHLYKPKTE